MVSAISRAKHKLFRQNLDHNMEFECKERNFMHYSASKQFLRGEL
jgi:hypothetical protein